MHTYALVDERPAGEVIQQPGVLYAQAGTCCKLDLRSLLWESVDDSSETSTTPPNGDLYVVTYQSLGEVGSRRLATAWLVRLSECRIPL